MITIVAHDAEFSRRVPVTTTSDARKAREMVRAQSGQAGSSIVRPTAYDLDTGHTIAGPGRLGRRNGRTDRAKARRAMTPTERRHAVLLRRRATAAARKAKRDARAYGSIKEKVAAAKTPPAPKKKG